jgi:hypothetical protein
VIEPWNSDVFSEKQFKECCQTGDLLLFQGSMSGPMLIRTVTGSQFDHVALLLKFDHIDDVYLVEAVGNRGVSYNKWEYLREHIGKGKFYSKLSYRKVLTANDASKKLGDFLK